MWNIKFYIFFICLLCYQHIERQCSGSAVTCQGGSNHDSKRCSKNVALLWTSLTISSTGFLYVTVAITTCQSLGYHVSIINTNATPISFINQALKKTQYSHINFSVISFVDMNAIKFSPSKSIYELFFYFDHSLFPEHKAIGHNYNIYVCYAEETKIPFKRNILQTINILSSYNMVIYHSNLTMGMFYKFIQPYLEEITSNNMIIPTVPIPQLSNSFQSDQIQTTSIGNIIKNIVRRGILSSPFRIFTMKYLPIYRKKILNIARISDKMAIIIEPQIHSTFEICVRNIMFHLGPTWSLTVYYSYYNEEFIRFILYNIPNIQYQLLIGNSYTINDYNTLLKSSLFWRNIPAKKVLIFQSDSIMLRSGIDKYLQYDYIGGAWDIKHNSLIKTLITHNKTLKIPVGNGGFSLRNVEAMRNICEKYSSTSSLEEQEDIFFSTYVEVMGYSKAPLRIAYEFCREGTIKDFKGRISHLAIHAPWFYMPERHVKMILASCEHV